MPVFIKSKYTLELHKSQWICLLFINKDKHSKKTEEFLMKEIAIFILFA